MPSIWTDETVGELKKLWDDGLSASAIGKILGVPRNAVLGKTHRLGWKRKEAAPADARVPRPASRRVPGVPAGATDRRRIHPVEPPDQPSAPGGQPVPHAPAVDPAMPGPVDASVEDTTGPTEDFAREHAVMRLGASSCRFPLGDPQSSSFRFCCRTAVTGGPYCSEHAAIAYMPAKVRLPKAAGPLRNIPASGGNRSAYLGARASTNMARQRKPG
jgi:GcrA cell cycle regulator